MPALQLTPACAAPEATLAEETTSATPWPARISVAGERVAGRVRGWDKSDCGRPTHNLRLSAQRSLIDASIYGEDLLRSADRNSTSRPHDRNRSPPLPQKVPKQHAVPSQPFPAILRQSHQSLEATVEGTSRAPFRNRSATPVLTLVAARFAPVVLRCGAVSLPAHAQYP